MRERIRGYSDAVIEAVDSPEGRAALADELAGVQTLLRENVELRAVLSDPGVPPHSRRAVLEAILEPHVGAPALRLVRYVAEADRATEFTDNISWMAARGAAARDDLVPAAHGPLGRHAATERLEGYTSALLEDLPDRHALGELEDELFRYTRVIDGSEQLRAVLMDMDVAEEARHAIVTDLLARKASEPTEHIAAYATLVGRPRDYLELLESVIERVAAETDRRVAEVRAARPLTGEQERRLSAALAKIIGHDLDLRVTVDRAVLGGFVATIGDAIIDGSARHRLEVLRERLVAPEATVTT